MLLFCLPATLYLFELCRCVNPVTRQRIVESWAVLCLNRKLCKQARKLQCAPPAIKKKNKRPSERILQSNALLMVFLPTV